MDQMVKQITGRGTRPAGGSPLSAAMAIMIGARSAAGLRLSDLDGHGLAGSAADPGRRRRSPGGPAGRLAEAGAAAHCHRVLLLRSR